MSNLKHQAAVERTSELVDQLRADIAKQLDVLVDVATQLEDLTDTRQSVGLGFMTEQGKELANRQTELDRAAARNLHDPREVGHGFLNSAAVLGTGQVAPPVTMAAVSVAAEIRYTLLHHLRRLSRPGYLRALEEEQLNAEDHGICTWPRNLLVSVALDTDATTRVLAGRLEALLYGYANRSGLEGILRDLDRLETTARDVVDGPAKTNHPDACPWCGEDSLVIHHREKGRDVQIIRCEGRHACRCDYEFCDCHRNTVRNRHEWVNSGRAAHTWNELHNLQTARKETLAMETRALDALDRIRQLHQPTWTDDNGNEIPAYVYLSHDGGSLRIPDDHLCAHPGPTGIFSGDEVPTPGCYHAEEDLILHAVPVCTRCGTAGLIGDLDDAVLWPCPTAQACDLDNTNNSPDTKE